MMMRGLVLLLLLLNVGYFTWSRGYVSAYGLGPAELNEPQRIAQQIRPNDLRVLSSDMAARLDATQATTSAPASAPEPSPTSCLQVGPFDEQQAQTLGRALETTLPADSWQLEPTVRPARWIIYMGKYESTEAVVRKKAELRHLGILSDLLHNPGMEPGISLGGFDSQAAAAAGLAKLAQKGVRTARVLQESAELHGQLLRMPQADDRLRGLLDGVKPALLGKPVQTCPPTPTTGNQAASANPQPGHQSER